MLCTMIGPSKQISDFGIPKEKLEIHVKAQGKNKEKNVH